MLHSIQLGTIGTIAGVGEPGYQGDGESAINALLNEPKNIALDRSGNLYIVDSENHVIRCVNSQTGIINTLAGCVHHEHSLLPATSSAMDGCEESDDPLADPLPSPDTRYTQQSDVSGMVRYVIGAKSGNEHFYGDGGPASQATLNFPSGIVLSSVGMAYIADTWNHRIRCVDLNSGIITTIAGTGQAKFSGDHGPASTATLNEPVALALDNLNCLFVADQSNN